MFFLSSSSQNNNWFQTEHLLKNHLHSIIFILSFSTYSTYSSPIFPSFLLFPVYFLLSLLGFFSSIFFCNPSSLSFIFLNFPLVDTSPVLFLSSFLSFSFLTFFILSLASHPLFLSVLFPVSCCHVFPPSLPSPLLLFYAFLTFLLFSSFVPSHFSLFPLPCLLPFLVVSPFSFPLSSLFFPHFSYPPISDLLSNSFILLCFSLSVRVQLQVISWLSN